MATRPNWEAPTDNVPIRMNDRCCPTSWEKTRFWAAPIAGTQSLSGRLLYVCRAGRQIDCYSGTAPRLETNNDARLQRTTAFYFSHNENEALLWLSSMRKKVVCQYIFFSIRVMSASTGNKLEGVVPPALQQKPSHLSRSSVEVFEKDEFS